jgi:type IV fimbrial biogenesis protein FimT
VKKNVNVQGLYYQIYSNSNIASKSGRADIMIKPQKFNSGFTLMEVMIVIAIIGIMVGIAIPAMTTWLPEFRLRSAARDIISCIQEMKMAAITKNTNTVAVFNLTSDSYVSFVDNGEGGGVKHDDTQNGSESYLKNIDMPAGVQLASSTFSSNSSGYFICFNSRGLLSQGSTSGNIILQNSNLTNKKITINSAGSIRVE